MPSLVATGELGQGVETQVVDSRVSQVEQVLRGFAASCVLINECVGEAWLA
jgi:hypothetical protein